MSDKKNCWEVMHCGREPGGVNADREGVCPAAVDSRFNQVHGGKNAGRVCWAVAGTLCGSAVEGKFAKKLGNCMICPFFSQVVKEEAEAFITTRKLANSINTFFSDEDSSGPQKEEAIAGSSVKNDSSTKG